MEPVLFERLKTLITTASAGQTLELEDVIHGIIKHQFAEIALARRARRTCDTRICPHCEGNDIMLHGKDQNGRQRFKCRSCRRSYNILTGTPMARARKPEKWGEYLDCMTDHMPLRTIVASGIGVHLVTAWRWRHRFLKAAANDNASVLSGVVEADTTFFRRSFKGSRDLNKGNPPKSQAVLVRGGGAVKLGLSLRNVPVLTAIDSGGGVVEAILPSMTEIEAALDGRIAAGSVLCSHEIAAYFNIAERSDAQHFVVLDPAGTPHATPIKSCAIQMWKPGRLGLRRVNSHHQRLKYLVNGRCRGVATKYLAHYLGWHRAMSRPGFQGKMLLDRALR